MEPSWPPDQGGERSGTGNRRPVPAPAMTDSVRPGAQRENSYFHKGCNPYAQTGRSKLQTHRVSLNQQIIKAMRLRAGAENLLRVTDNTRVREVVLLELSFVNSNLQLLREELETVNGSVQVYQGEQDSLCFPLIPLGLKETKEVDFLLPFKDFIQEHYSESPALYEEQILDLMDLRQATRTPRRSVAGVELLTSYYRQLTPLESRFFPGGRHPHLFFTWYDSLTGLPVCQPHLSLEKASVLFNMAALYTQNGARTDRRSPAGLHAAAIAFRSAAGLLSELRETYTHVPSFDLSPAVQGVLLHLLLAQARECSFEEMVLAGTANRVSSLLRLAQEAAQLSDTYTGVELSSGQAAVQSHVPPAWRHTVQVKLQHYRGLAHYLVSIALIDHRLGPSDDVDQQEQVLTGLYDQMPNQLHPLTLLRSGEHRLRLGKAHLRSAIMAHEEALRVQGLCPSLKKMQIFQNILRGSHRRSLAKFTELELEDDFDIMEAPHIIGKSSQQIEILKPDLSSDKVVDLFQKLGPLAVFCARQRWTAPRKIQLQPAHGERGFGLRDEAVVRVTAVEPGCSAAAAGLKDGDVVVSVGGTDCKWASASEVEAMLQDMPADGLDIQVISAQGLEAAQVPKSATFCVGLSKAYSQSCWVLDEGKGRKGKKVSKKLSFLNWASKNSKKTASTTSLPSAVDNSIQPGPSIQPADGSSLY